MAQFLVSLATIVNVAGLTIALCLGLYIITRTPRSRLSWLAAAALWVLTGFFLHNVLVLHLPDSGVLYLLRPLVVLVLPLGFHLTLLLPPAEEQPGSTFFQPALRLPEVVRQGLGTLALPLSRLVVPLAYVLALGLAIGGVFPLGRAPQDTTSPALYLSDRVAGPLYPLSLVYLLFLVSLATWHLWQGRRQAASRGQKRQYNRLLIATALTGLGGLYLALGVWFGLRLPSLPGDMAIGVAAGLLGYTVARYNARVEGRDMRQELSYITLIVGLFTLFYTLFAALLYMGGQIFSVLTLILIIVVSVSTLMLYDGLRTILDRLFYRQQFWQLRANLRALTREAGIGQPLPERLQALLSALCRTLGIQSGFVALRHDDSFVCEATERSVPTRQVFPFPTLTATEITTLLRPEAESPAGMALLVPIHDGDVQIGALALGPREAGGAYSAEDLLLLDDLADQVADLIQDTTRQEEEAQVLNQMVAEFREREHALQRQMQQMLVEREEDARPVLAGIDDKEFASLVEDALRRLHDYPYLGEQTLARLAIVTGSLEDCDEAFVTHIECGKALSEVLQEALNKLRPPGPEPGTTDVPPREWHQFLILHGAYVEGKLNRDIMSWLYVGEGTFNRTRRRALRGVAKALQEMEREAQQRAAE